MEKKLEFNAHEFAYAKRNAKGLIAMKICCFVTLLLIQPFLAFSQSGNLKVLPELGLSKPLGDFQDVNVFANDGIQAGLHVDWMFGKFGLGMYGGLGTNKIKYDDQLPTGSLEIIASKSTIGNKFKWSQLLFGLGPIYNLDISEKLGVELTSKFGLAKISYPDYKQLIEFENPSNREYLFYETKNEDVEGKLNLMLFSALRLNFQATRSIDISLSTNYTIVQNVLHSYSYLDGGFNPDMTNDQVIDAVQDAPTVTEVWKCHFNSVGVALGVGFTLGSGKKEPKEPKKDDPKEDEKMEPPVTSYPEDGSTIPMQEADSLVLQWLKETPNVEKANYNLWLYEVRDSSSADSLIFKTKINRDIKLLLPDNINLENGKTYRWEVRAIDASELKPCPGECYSNKATFNISISNQVQYYHLLTQNVGNYIENNGPLRFLLPNHIEVGGKVQARILNQLNEQVLFIEALESNTKGENYSVDEFGRVMVNTGRLADGYYLLEVFNENKKDYYLRFLIDKTANDEKD